MQYNMNKDGADECVKVQRLTRLNLAARSGRATQRQNLAAVSTATLVRKVSPVLPPYTASDLWDGVHDGILVQSEIIWWLLGELMQSLVEIKPDVQFVKPLASSRKHVLDRNPFRAKLSEYMSRFDHPSCS